MTTGVPFRPTAFTTTQVAAAAQGSLRTLPYVAPSEYRFAPTAVSSQKLVAGSTQPSSDSLASLAFVLSRASSWVDQICFKRPAGDFQASQIVESQWVKIKGDGSLRLICNYRPVWEVVGLALGASPSLLANVGQAVASDIYIEGKVIRVPAAWSNLPLTPSPPRSSTAMYAVWIYVQGYPNFSIGGGPTEIAKGATTLTLNPATTSPGATTLPAIYSGTQLTIYDGANTEVVVAASTPSGLTLNLASATVNDHNVPAAPDFLRIGNFPQAIEQAVIHLASVLFKTQGSRAMIMSGAPGGVPSTQAMSQAGALQEYQQARLMLKPFEVVFLHD